MDIMLVFALPKRCFSSNLWSVQFSVVYHNPRYPLGLVRKRVGPSCQIPYSDSAHADPYQYQLSHLVKPWGDTASFKGGGEGVVMFSKQGTRWSMCCFGDWWFRRQMTRNSTKMSMSLSVIVMSCYPILFFHILIVCIVMQDHDQLVTNEVKTKQISQLFSVWCPCWEEEHHR